jgi:hypothetical protein
MLAAERLHAGLLVDAQHRGTARRGHVQRADFGHLVPKLRIRAMQPQTHPMRPHLCIVQDADHAGAAQLRPAVLTLDLRDHLVELIQGPHLTKGNAEIGSLPARHRNHLAATRPIDGGRTPRTRQFVQPLQTPCHVAIAPQSHRLAVHIQPLRHPAHTRILGQHQYHLGSQRQCAAPTSSCLLQPPLPLLAQTDQPGLTPRCLVLCLGSHHARIRSPRTVSQGQSSPPPDWGRSFGTLY